MKNFGCIQIFKPQVLENLDQNKFLSITLCLRIQTNPERDTCPPRHNPGRGGVVILVSPAFGQDPIPWQSHKISQEDVGPPNPNPRGGIWKFLLEMSTQATPPGVISELSIKTVNQMSKCPRGSFNITIPWGIPVPWKSFFFPLQIIPAFLTFLIKWKVLIRGKLCKKKM